MNLCCRKGDPFQKLSGLLSNTQEWIIIKRHVRWQSKIFHWEGAPGWRVAGSGDPGGLLWMRPEVSGFMATEFISGLSLDNHSSSGSFLAVRALLSQDGFQQGGFWEGTWTVAPASFCPFSSSCWWWVISSVFLTRTSCYKITHAHVYYGVWPGWSVSARGPPNICVFESLAFF